jgi:hypothetical protein
MTFRCWAENENEERDGTSVEADDGEEAAEKYAEIYFDAYAETPEKITISTRQLGVTPEPAPERWVCDPDYVVEWYARPAKEEEPSKG